MIKVKIYLDKEKVQEVELLRTVETLGRSRQCTLRLGDTSISARHCEIRVTPEGALLVDSGSKNGTRLNDLKVDKAILKVGDRIRLGRIGLLVTQLKLDKKVGRAVVVRKKKPGRPLRVRRKDSPNKKPAPEDTVDRLAQAG